MQQPIILHKTLTSWDNLSDHYCVRLLPPMKYHRPAVKRFSFKIWQLEEFLVSLEFLNSILENKVCYCIQRVYHPCLQNTLHYSTESSTCFISIRQIWESCPCLTLGFCFWSRWISYHLENSFFLFHCLQTASSHY